MMARGDGRHRAGVGFDGATGGTPPAHRRSATRAYRPNDLRRDPNDGVQLLQPADPRPLSKRFPGVQHGFDHATITTIALIYNAGAVIGGILFGALSQHIGRRITIVMAALLSLPVLPFWAFGSTALTLAIAAFLMQICVQGAWGVIPAHLNELSPPRYPGDVSWRGVPTRQSVGFIMRRSRLLSASKWATTTVGRSPGSRSGGSGDRYSGRLRHGGTTRQDGRRRAPRAHSIAERQ